MLQLINWVLWNYNYQILFVFVIIVILLNVLKDFLCKLQLKQLSLLTLLPTSHVTNLLLSLTSMVLHIWVFGMNRLTLRVSSLNPMIQLVSRLITQVYQLMVTLSWRTVFKTSLTVQDVVLQDQVTAQMLQVNATSHFLVILLRKNSNELITM